MTLRGALAGAAALTVALAAACGSTPLHERYQAPPDEAPIASSSATPSSAHTKLCRGPELDAGPDATPARIAARHVLIQWMGCRRAGLNIVRTRDQAYRRAQEVLQKVRAGQDLGRLAMDYSDEEGAGARGGSLGCFGHGAMDKKFEHAAFALQPGEVSDIVESPFGFHIIQRTE